VSTSGGSVSYAGYEYQLLVTVWSALELIIVKAAAEELQLEARSHEDIEADLQVARDDAVVSVAAKTSTVRLVIQVKTRSTGPWSASHFKSVLLGAKPRHAKKGPAPRKRALDMLQDDRTMRYVFLTDAATQGELRSLRVDHMLQESGAAKLPFKLPSPCGGFHPDLARRIAVLDMQLEELVNYRIAEILTRHAHVPIPNHAQCVRDLRDKARSCVLTGVALQASAVWQVLGNHGGSKGPSQDIDNYIAPRSYPAIVKQLEQYHAVVISGPSGTGKTLTGLVLEERLKQELPYTVVTKEGGFSVIERSLLIPGPVLFHLRDPWGSTKAENDGAWTNELVNTLPRATAQHKFVVTTRSEILAQSAKERLSALEPFIVRIDITDYDADLRGQIFDRKLKALSDNSTRFAERHRDKVIKKLLRPYEIHRFIVNIQRPESLSKPIEDILDASRVEAVADVVAQEIAEWSPEGPACAAIIWALLQADFQVPWSQLRTIERRFRRGGRVLELEQFADFLAAGYHLRPGIGTIVLYHPEVERGLEKGMDRARSEVERTLELLCDALLLDGNDADAAVAMAFMDAIVTGADIKVSLRGSTAQALDEALLNAATAEAPAPTQQPFGRLVRLASAGYAPADFVRILMEKDSDHWALGAWALPSQEERALMSRVARERPLLVHNYIRDIVPRSNVVYNIEFVDIMTSLIPDVDKAFLSALMRAPDDGWAMNLRALVLGACSGPEPPLCQIKEVGELLLERADERWASEFERDETAVNEYQIDQHYIEYFNTVGEQLWDPGVEVLETLVRVVRRSVGFRWLIGPEKSPALSMAWVRALEDVEAISTDELLAVASETTLEASPLFWRVVAAHWDSALEPVFKSAFLRDDLTPGVRRVLVKIALTRVEGAETLLGELLAASSEERQLEILLDVASASLEVPDDVGTTYERLTERLAEKAARPVAVLASTVLAGLRDPSKVAGLLTKPNYDAESALLARARDDVVAALIVDAGRAGVNVIPAATRVITGGSAQSAKAAVRALSNCSDPLSSALVSAALSHVTFSVRLQALRQLLQAPYPSYQDAILACARDPSSVVRLEFTAEMKRLRWPEAVPALLDLLFDMRDFSWHLAYSEWSRYDVALGAAHALAAYDALPDGARGRLHTFLASDSDDERVVRAVDGLIRRFSDRLYDRAPGVE
jgi:hypothetical protein